MHHATNITAYHHFCLMHLLPLSILAPEENRTADALADVWIFVHDGVVGRTCSLLELDVRNFVRREKFRLAFNRSEMIMRLARPPLDLVSSTVATHFSLTSGK